MIKRELEFADIPEGNGESRSAIAEQRSTRSWERSIDNNR